MIARHRRMHRRFRPAQCRGDRNRRPGRVARRRFLRGHPSRPRHRSRSHAAGRCGMAPERDRPRPGVSAKQQPPGHRHRRRDRRCSRSRGAPAGRPAARHARAVSLCAAAGWRQVFRPERPLVPAGRRTRGDVGAADRGAAADRQPRPRSQPARAVRHAGDVCRRRGAGNDAAAIDRLNPTLAAIGGGCRRRAGGKTGAAFLAADDDRPDGGAARAPPVRAGRSGARFHRTRARRPGARRGSPAGGRAGTRSDARGSAAHDGAGGAGRRAVCDLARRGAEIDHPLRCHGRRDPLRRAAFSEAGWRDPGDAGRRPRADRRVCRAGDRILEPDLGGVRGPLHRPRGRFQHPVQRALPRPAAPPRHSAGCAAGHRPNHRPGARPCRRRDGDRLPVVCTHAIHRDPRARLDRRVRHDHRDRAEFPAAPGRPRAVAAARRARAGRVSPGRPARPLPLGAARLG